MYVVFSIIFFFIGYFIFLVSYPVKLGIQQSKLHNTNVSYVGILSAIYLEKQKRKVCHLFNGCEYFYCVFFHNFSAMMSHFEHKF